MNGKPSLLRIVGVLLVCCLLTLACKQKKKEDSLTSAGEVVALTSLRSVYDLRVDAGEAGPQRCLAVRVAASDEQLGKALVLVPRDCKRDFTAADWCSDKVKLSFEGQQTQACTSAEDVIWAQNFLVLPMAVAGPDGVSGLLPLKNGSVAGSTRIAVFESENNSLLQECDLRTCDNQITRRVGLFGSETLVRDNGVNPVFLAPGKNFLTGFVKSDGSVISLEGFGRREDVQGRLKQYSKDGEELVILPGGLAVKERLGFGMKKATEGDSPRYDLFLRVDTLTQSELDQDDLRVTVAGQPVAISGFIASSNAGEVFSVEKLKLFQDALVTVSWLEKSITSVMAYHRILKVVGEPEAFKLEVQQEAQP